MKIKIFIFLAVSFISSIAYYYYNSSHTNDSSLLQWQQSNESNIHSIDHSVWQGILQTYLHTMHESEINLVDYSNFDRDDIDLLAKYLKRLSLLEPRDYSRIEQKAYWINLYNALTVKLVLDNYPLESITKIGKKLTAFGPWDDPLITIAGEKLSLNDIEHKILRPLWRDPRIHFAVNCASYSCPNLQDIAFTSLNIDSLLNKAAMEYMTHPRGAYFDDNVLVLSSIFDWYAEDFGANTDEILGYLSRYMPDDIADKLKNHQGEVRYEYDWRLNDVELFE